MPRTGFPLSWRRYGTAQNSTLTVDDAVPRTEQLVVARGAALAVDGDLPVGGVGRRELDAKVGHLAHHDLVQEHAGNTSRRRREEKKTEQKKKSGGRSTATPRESEQKCDRSDKSAGTLTLIDSLNISGTWERGMDRRRRDRSPFVGDSQQWRRNNFPHSYEISCLHKTLA